MSKEIQRILAELDTFEPNQKAVLATVVDLKGSGYRLPGARMLIEGDGDTIGTVSGGCLESDVMERAKRVIASGLAEVFVYDTTAEENSVFSLNMGCRGVMRILIEPVAKDSEIVAKLNFVRSERKDIVSATVIGSADAKVAVGARIYDFEDNEICDPSGLLRQLPQVGDDLRTFNGSTSLFETIDYELTPGSLIEFVFETLRPPVRVVILGAGADAVPVAEIGHSLGWQIDIYDHRPAFLSDERFPNADHLVMLNREQTPEFSADHLTAFVAMNHNYDRDKALLAAALKTNAFYVGALGPKKRTAQILDELADAGTTFDASHLAKLRSPAGLDIGGSTPETIAISIIAEIQSVLNDREGGPLQKREAPIYDRH